jgi:ketosteroid isomerase-like protein
MMRTIFAIAIAAIMVAAGPAPAQQAQTPTGASPFAADVQRYEEAFNKKDAAGVTALYADDAIFTGAPGILRGRDAILKNREAAVKNLDDLSVHPVAFHVEGNMGWGVSEWKARLRGQDGGLTPINGFSHESWVRDGNTWKIRAHMVIRAAPPPQK